jgi:hypothetical protein
MAIVDGFNYWLLDRADAKDDSTGPVTVATASQLAI